MILSGLVLFLFGTTVSAAPFVEPTEIIISKNPLHPYDKTTEYYTSSNTSPFISNFIQEGTNVFFKPLFILSAAQMPPQVQAVIAEIEKDDCMSSYPMGPVPAIPIVGETLRAIASPGDKEFIEINPMPFPNVALPRIPLSAYIPEVAMAEPVIPVFVEVEEARAPVVIPPAPVLPPLELPKMPMVVPVPEEPMIIEVEQPAEFVVPMIVPAQELPPLDLPKVSMLVEEPCAPADIIVEPMPQSEVVEIIKPDYPMVIPEAPVLPPYVPVEIPAPVIVEELKPMSFEIESEIKEPAVIPPAPLLPPLDIPKMPVLVEESNIIPCPPGEEPHLVLPTASILPSYQPEVIISQPASLVIENRPIVIPHAPELPPFLIPKFPVEVVVGDKLVPNAVPVVPCDTVEMIEKHVEPIVIPAPSYLPPMAPLKLPAPVIFEVEKELAKPVIAPAAPVLPPLQMPETLVAVPCI